LSLLLLVARTLYALGPHLQGVSEPRRSADGLRNTAPYFHNNSADSLEEVVDHYVAFYQRVQVIAQLPEERATLLAYLRML